MDSHVLIPPTKIFYSKISLIPWSNNSNILSDSNYLKMLYKMHSKNINKLNFKFKKISKMIKLMLLIHLMRYRLYSLSLRAMESPSRTPSNVSSSKLNCNNSLSPSVENSLMNPIKSGKILLPHSTHVYYSLY